MISAAPKQLCGVVVLVVLVTALCRTACAQPSPPPVSFAASPNTGCKVGRANIKTGDSVAWQGPCVDGYAQGAGVAQWSSNGRPTLRYEGSFNRGLIEGKGRMRGAEGDQYDGDFRGGLRHGIGSYVASDGSRYDGPYVNNQRAPGATDPAAVSPQRKAQEPAPNSGATGTVAGASPAGARGMIGRCKDETRQGQLGPFRQQDAVIWGLVTPEVAASFEHAPKSAPSLGLSDPALSGAAPVIREALRMAAEKCGVVLPRAAQTLGAASVQVLLFRDALPRGGPIRPDEREANFRNDDAARLAAAVVTSDGSKFGFGNHSDPATQSQLRASLEAKRRVEAAKTEESNEQQRMTAFFAKHGVSAFVDERALQTNPFAFEGKTVVVKARFVQMLSASKAAMNMPGAQYFVVSDIPREAFAVTRTTSWWERCWAIPTSRATPSRTRCRISSTSAH
jgi:hypothetical protein